MIKSKDLEWGQTPFDDLSRAELLRLVQAYHSALMSCNAVLHLAKGSNPLSRFWGSDGTGGRAITKAEALMTLAGEPTGAERIYHSFFRYVDDLFFPGIDREKWGIASNGDMTCPAAMGSRPLRWTDLLPESVRSV
jgi:hypothetical protein